MTSFRIDPRKITHYLLRDDHLTGGGKSRFFRAFGFSADDWEMLRIALLAHPRVAELVDEDETSRFGIKRVYRCNLPSPDSRNPCILSVWQQRDGDWHLVTAYPFL